MKPQIQEPPTCPASCPALAEPDNPEQQLVLDLLRHYQVRTAGQAITRIEGWIAASAEIHAGDLIAGLGDNEPGLVEGLQAELDLLRQHAELRRDLEAEFAVYEAEQAAQGLHSDFDEFENEATMGATYDNCLAWHEEFEPERLIRSAAPPDTCHTHEALASFEEYPSDSKEGHLFGLMDEVWIPCRHMDEALAEEHREEEEERNQMEETSRLKAEDEQLRLLARMRHYVEQKMPLVKAELDHRMVAGEDIAGLVGLITDGKEGMGNVGPRATVVPLAVARKIGATAAKIPDFAEAVRLLDHPEPGTFLIIVYYRGQPAFVRVCQESASSFVRDTDFIERDGDLYMSAIGAVKLAYLSDPAETEPEGRERLARFKARMDAQREYLQALHGRAPTLEEMLAPVAAKVRQAMNRGDFDIARVLFTEEKAS